MQCVTTNVIPVYLRDALNNVRVFLKYKLENNMFDSTLIDNSTRDLIHYRSLSSLFEINPLVFNTKTSEIKSFELHLWQNSINNVSLNEGYHCIPIASTSSIPFPLNINREDEVLIMSMFYKNNLTNSFLYEFNPNMFSSPLCTYGCQHIETPLHIITACLHNPYCVDLMNIVQSINVGYEDLNSHLNLINASRIKQFISISFDYLKNCDELKRTINLR